MHAPGVRVRVRVRVRCDLILEALELVHTMETKWRDDAGPIHKRTLRFIERVLSPEPGGDVDEHERDNFYAACKALGRWKPSALWQLLDDEFDRRHPVLDGARSGIARRTDCDTCDLHMAMNGEGLYGASGGHLCSRILTPFSWTGTTEPQVPALRYEPSNDHGRTGRRPEKADLARLRQPVVAVTVGAGGVAGREPGLLAKRTRRE